MADIQKYLDETKKNIDALVTEISELKNARVLNEKTTNSLISMSKALDLTISKIEPYQDVKLKQFKLFMVGVSLLNTLLLITILVLFILK